MYIFFNAWNDLSSLRGALKYKYVNCNIVSKSLTEAFPEKPSLYAFNSGDTDTFLPDKYFSNSIAVKSPTPLAFTISAAIIADGKSANFSTFDKPPLLVAVIKISSCLNVVGLITTFTPLFKIHSVVPRASLVVTDLILPHFGALLTNGLFIVSSLGATNSVAFTVATTANVSSLDGNFTVSLLGAMKLMIKFSSVT